MGTDVYAKTDHDHLSLEEFELYNLINDYRVSLGLERIALSKGLTATAGRHVVDTRDNIWGEDVDLPGGANLHSWSDAYYYGDHRDPEAMWEAPERLGTGYTDSGYEISAAGYGSIEAALEGWINSPGHNAVMANLGIWANVDFNAIGVGVETTSGPGPYSGRIYHVWFGRAADPDGPARIIGTSDGDEIVGTSFRDDIRGGNGRDNLDGGSGSDRLSGGNQSDRIIGGGGRDLIFGGNGNDVLKGNNGRDTIKGGNGSDELYGGGGSDRLFGRKSSDKLLGGSGNDHVIGGHGRDLLKGGNGQDTIKGGNGSDKVFGGKGSDELSGGNSSDKILGGSGNDQLIGGKGSDLLKGNSGQDKLKGGNGNDDLRGGDGADHLFGGRGADKMRGGTGDDTFHFENLDDSKPGSSRGRILDFGDGDDVIDVTEIDAKADKSGNQSFNYIKNDSFSGTAGELRFGGGVLKADVDGDGETDFEVRLMDVSSLSASDILL